jgi:hypothetical protein
VEWALTSDGLGPGGLISGYKLYMDDGEGGDFNVVMDTVGYSSQIKEYLAVNLTESLQYRFQLEAYNYNELAPGDLSEVSSIYACDKPKIDNRPNKVSTSLDSIKINWR